MNKIRIRIKQILSLALGAAVVCAIAACGSPEPAIQIFEDVNAQPEYLSFFSSDSIYDSDVTKYWIDCFTEKYNKKVYINFDQASYYADEGQSYRELLEKRLESSAPDDLYIISAEDVLAFERKDYWMDLSGMDFVNNLSEDALYQSTYNGKVFSVPLSYTGFGFVWNMDLLQEHGLSMPENLGEFLNVCEVLKNSGVLPYGANKGFALTVPVMCTGLAELYESEDREARMAALNSGDTPVSSYVRKGFEFLAMMIEKGYIDPQQALKTTPREEDIELFREGECAFICLGLGDCGTMQDLPFEVKATGLPVLLDGCIAVSGADSRLCVNPKSKHLDTVLEFVEMVGTQEALVKSAELDRAMSSAKEESTKRFLLEEELVELLRQPGQIPNQDFSLHFNTWENIRNVSREICSGVTIEEACAMLDEKQQEELRNYGIGKENKE